MQNLSEINCTKCFNVQSMGKQYSYVVQAVMSDDTKYYLAVGEYNESALYTKKPIIEDLDLDAGDELAINYLFIDPEWSPAVLHEICVEYKEGKLKYLSDEMKYNLDCYISDMGYDEIYESYIACKGSEFEI